ncbi:PEP-utilizing enzyme [Nocardia veterana]|uniref:Peptidase n=1 Tax=Nocardia veterana TaxID=132249 RepID=A0A7X6RJ21_9NOCA|nr:PEP-utilizing enzyme [Nocardia veterana]NKY87740.1 peptidase [Nocardia veterana]
MSALTPATDTLFDPVHGTSESDRFWTLANTGEVTPGILAALDWSVWDNFELAVRQAWFDLGIMRKSDVYLPSDPNLRQTFPFYGRHALNVDYVRTFMGSVPGASPNDFERDICGTVRPGMPDTKGSNRRLPAMVRKLPSAYRRTTRELHARHQDTHEWWQKEVFHAGGGGDALADLHASAQRFRETMSLHIRVRTFLQGVQGALTDLAGACGRSDLALAVFSGFGGVSESALAEDIWGLGNGRLTMQAFLERHGYYGPNEGMVWTSSWREDQSPLHALTKSVAARSVDEARSRAEDVIRAREEAERELLACLPRTRKPVARFLFRQAATQVRNLELGKATYHMALDGCRAAARRLGAELHQRGMVADPEDVFFLTMEELREPPQALRALVAFRRQRRKEYDAITLPMTFYGVPEPVRETGADSCVTELTGIGASSGVVSGRARVVDDIVDDEIFDSGDILICRTTNPSWTPLFTLVDAVVIDIGSTASHGAIVARELGIPCVINTGSGSRVIRTGDMIRVDGTAGVVTIVERRSSA